MCAWLKACMWKNSFRMNASFNPWNMIWVQIFCITMSSTLLHSHTPIRTHTHVYSHTLALTLILTARGAVACGFRYVGAWCKQWHNFVPYFLYVWACMCVLRVHLCVCVCVRVHLYLPTANTSLARRLPTPCELQPARQQSKWVHFLPMAVTLSTFSSVCLSSFPLDVHFCSCLRFLKSICPRCTLWFSGSFLKLKLKRRHGQRRCERGHLAHLLTSAQAAGGSGAIGFNE